MKSCALCGDHAKLSKSHIIPEFIYTPIYNDKHFYDLLSVSNPLKRSRPTGYYERLLCQKCEAQLSLYETEAKELLEGKNRTIEKAGKNGNLMIIRGSDYKKLKLFQLSIIWRASVSKGEMFAKVRLGPYEEIIRKMLLHETPGEPGEYGCTLYGLLHDGDLVNKMILEPTLQKINHCHVYNFVFGGLLWSFFIAGKNPIELSSCFLQKDGTLYIMMKPFDSLKFAIDSLNKIAKKEYSLTKV